MRVQKGVASDSYTAYAYDGQMPMEEFNFMDDYPSRTFVKVIRYGLGARGIDRIEREQVFGTKLIGYPLYDAHGNNVATLMKAPSNSYSIGDQRSYDAWGGIRTGNTSGEPNPRHCANLGHISDDESGFVYMRARYYEPGNGRFTSEDPARNGLNWYGYCSNSPVGRSDRTGKEDEETGVNELDVIQEILHKNFGITYPQWFVRLTKGINDMCVRLGMMLALNAMAWEVYFIGSTCYSAGGPSFKAIGLLCVESLMVMFFILMTDNFVDTFI
jgi:RHS repeat-associated protein